MRRLSWLVVLLLAVAGCGGSSSGTPRTLPPVSASPSPSPVPSPSASMTPEQAVLAAVRAYYDAVNAATQDGDTSRMRALAVPNCDCKKLADSISTSYRAGNRFLGARDTITDLRLVSLIPPAASVAIKIHIGAYTLLKPDGTKKAYSAETFTGGVRLIQRNGRWLFVSVQGA